MKDTKTFAYIRVSTTEQNTDRQYEAIKEYCNNNNILLSDRDVYTDKLSGKDTNRPSLQALLHTIRTGDTLIVKELDRLGRNKEDIKDIIQMLKDKKVNLRILNIPTTLIDISKLQGNEWVFEMINNILIEVLGAIAQSEREKIKERQAEGIAIAKTKGVQFGRPSATYPDNWEDVYSKWKAGKIKGVQAMKELELKKTTFYKLVKEYENNQAI